MASRFMAKELEPGTDTLGPENRLYFLTGPLTGTQLPGSGRSSIAARSPLTGRFGEAQVGGYFGAELKKAGFDHLVVEGRAERPVYIWVHDGAAESGIPPESLGHQHRRRPGGYPVGRGRQVCQDGPDRTRGGATTSAMPA